MDKSFRDFEIEDIPEEYLTWRAERKRRLSVALAAVPAIIGLTFGFLAAFLPDFEQLMIFPGLNREIFGLVTPIMFLFSGLGVLMLYLQTGFSKKAERIDQYLRYEEELLRLREKVDNDDSYSNKELDFLKDQFSKLKAELENNSTMAAAISAEDKEELVSLLKSEIQNESTSSASQEFLEKIKTEIALSDRSKDIERVFSRTLERLYKETSALGRRGNLNLSLGVLTTIVGLGILGYFVIEIDAVPNDKVAFIAYFIPRLSLVILIEIFAYFFLKLYKSSLSEIKYFQNEMTNSEAKLIALKCSLMTDNSEAISNVIKVLSETERNAIIEKGQTTTEIEKLKVNQQNISAISENFAKAMNLK